MNRFITSLTIDSATDSDFRKVYRELEKNAIHITAHDHQPGGTKNPRKRVFDAISRTGLIDLTAALNNAASSSGKKYSFTIIREKATSSPGNGKGQPQTI